MKKNGRKLFALLLALVMLVGAVPLTVSAADPPQYVEMFEDGYYYEIEYEPKDFLSFIVSITGCDETVTGDIVLPSTLGGYNVRYAMVDAFCDRKDITHVTLPDGVVWAGRASWDYEVDESNWDGNVLYYQDCLLASRDLKGEYKVKDGTVYIAPSAFSAFFGMTDKGEVVGHNGNDELTSLILPDSVISIGSPWGYANDGISCENLEKLDLGKGVKCIRGINCPKLESLEIPESVEYIGYNAINCESLKDIKLPDKPIEIDEEAFQSTAYYKDESNWSNGVLYIGNHLIKVDEEKFEGSVLSVREGTVGMASCVARLNQKIEVVELPDSLRQLSDYAFHSCWSLKEVNIPDGIEIIPSYAFLFCTSLESVELPESVRIIGNGAFENCSSLKNVTISYGVTHIYNSAFWDCRELSSLGIPESVKMIGDFALSDNANLREIIIPRSVEYIGEKAYGFEECLGRCGESIFCGHRIKSDDRTIYGYKDTAAERYANENEIKFVDLENIPDPSEGCPCRCHKDGFDNLIYKILRIFWKLFRTHELCECGAKHY